MKKTLKKWIACLLAAVLLSGLMMPVFAASDSMQHIEAAIFDKNAWCEVDFDYSWLVTGNNKTYFSKLGVLSAILACNAQKMTFDRDGNRIEPTALLRQIGMSDPVLVELSADDYAADTNDLTGVSFSHVPLTVDGEAYEAIFVAMQGTMTTSEWLSNLDMGADNETYYNATGEHPEWRNKENHKGFDVAATRVEEKLHEYEAQYLNPNAKKCILFCGHSRGAAIANILGRLFEEKSEYKSFTYTLAAPNTTTAADGKAQDTTIFNLINEDDIVPVIPLNQWGFYRYGRDITGSVAKSQSELYYSETNKEYISANAQELVNAISETVEGREQLYTVGQGSASLAPLGGVFANAEAREEEMRKYLAKDGADNLVEFVTVGGVPQYRVSPAYALYVVSKVLASINLNKILVGGGISAKDIVEPMEILVTHPLPVAYYGGVAKLAQNLSVDGFMSSHSCVSYELLARDVAEFDDADFFPASDAAYTASVFGDGSAALLLVLLAVSAAGLGVLVWKRKPKKGK